LGWAALRSGARAPTAQSSLEFPEWTPQRLREHEAEAVERGSELRLVVGYRATAAPAWAG
jgi:hypothetical protein